MKKRIRAVVDYFYDDDEGLFAVVKDGRWVRWTMMEVWMEGAGEWWNWILTFNIKITMDVDGQNGQWLGWPEYYRFFIVFFLLSKIFLSK